MSEYERFGTIISFIDTIYLRLFVVRRSEIRNDTRARVVEINVDGCTVRNETGGGKWFVARYVRERRATSAYCYGRTISVRAARARSLIPA